MTKEQLRKGLILVVVVLAVVAVWYFKNSTPADSPSSEVISKPEGTLNEGSPASLIDQDLNNSESQSNEDTEDTEDENALPEYNFEVTDFNLEELKSYNVPILLQFGASWCPPCQEMKPYLTDLYDQYKDQMFILYLDVDLLENGTHGHPVQVLPTQFFYNADGTPLIPCDSFQNIERLVDTNTDEHVLTRNQGYLDLDSLVHLLHDMRVE